MLNRKLTTLCLIGLCAVLGDTIHKQWQTPQSSIAGSLANKATNTADLPNIQPLRHAGTFGRLTVFEEIIQRPLFTEGREPFVEEIIVEKKVTPPAPFRQPNLTLMGIIVTEDKKIALVKTQNNNKTQRIRLNENINSWKVSKVGVRSITLESRGQSFELEMAKKTNKNKKHSNMSRSQMPINMPDMNNRPDMVMHNIPMPLLPIQNGAENKPPIPNALGAVPDNLPLDSQDP